MKRSRSRVRKLKKRHESDLLSLAGVEAVGMGEKDGFPLIKVYVDGRSTRRDEIPSTIEDVPVVVEETDSFAAY